MSDDSITNFLQSHSAIERKTQLENPLEKEVQVTEFKELMSQEEKKLAGAQQESKADKQAEGENLRKGTASIDSSTGAIQSQKEGESVNISGNSFPNLALHNGALAVGRVIYTSEEVSVTRDSLSKFMVRQGLVNERLLEAGDSSDVDALVSESTEEALASRPQISSNQAVDNVDNVDNRDRSFRDDAATQLAVKQVINARGATGGSKLESLSGQNLYPNTIARSESNQIDQDQAATHRFVASEIIDAESAPKALSEVDDRRRAANLVSAGVPSSAGNKISIDQQLAQATKPAPEGNQAREVTNPSNALVGRGDQPSINQQFRDEAKSAVTDSEKFSDEPVLRNKDNQDDVLTKNQALPTKDESEAKKVQGNGRLELQRFLTTAQKALEGGSERSNSTLLNQPDINEASMKGHRDLGHYTTQETTHADPGQSRVEFRGALKDAQRLVASSTYNNLTDSYESWSSRFGEVLAHRIAGYINKENWSVQLRMNPASLGEISLEIDFSDKGLEGRFGSNEESTRQLLHDTLPKLRLALREILEENQGLKFDVSDFGNSNQNEEPEKKASPELVEEINFETEVLLGRTLDSKLSSVVGLDILV